MLLKLYMWFILFVMWGIILSYNTLISLFFFFYLVLSLSSLLLFLQIEFMAYLLLLIYLGGILVFFLFTCMMLHSNPISPRKNNGESASLNNNIYFFVLIIKILVCFSFLYDKVIFNFYSLNMSYTPNYIGNSDCFRRSLSYGSDSYVFTVLYYDKAILLILISLVLFLTIYGVIVLCSSKKKWSIIKY